MAKLFSIDHILHGDPPSSSRHNQSLIPSVDTAAAWINSNPLAAYPAIPGYWPAPPSTSIPAPTWFQPVDLMTSLWAAAAASSTTAVAAGSQWIPSTDVYAPSALMDPAGHHHALVYLNAGRAAAGLLQHPSHQPAARKGGQIRFSHRQSHQLEETFNATRYLTPSQRRVLAHRLSLSERQVKTWFQNRRAKWRRTKKEGKLAAEDEDEEISDDAEEDGQQ